MWDSRQDRVFLLTTSSLCFMDWFLLPPRWLYDWYATEDETGGRETGKIGSLEGDAERSVWWSIICVAQRFFLFLIVNSYLCCKVVDFIMSFHTRVKFLLCRPSSSSPSGEKGMLPCFWFFLCVCIERRPSKRGMTVPLFNFPLNFPLFSAQEHSRQFFIPRPYGFLLHSPTLPGASLITKKHHDCKPQGSHPGQVTTQITKGGKWYDTTADSTCTKTTGALSS